MRIVKPAAVYFALVFGAGFVLGTLRVLCLVPRIGVRAAELAESPLMLLVTVMVAWWVNRGWWKDTSPTARLAVGLTALTLLFTAEISLGLALRGGSVWSILFDKDPISGTVYYALLAVYALMPWLLGPAQRPTS